MKRFSDYFLFILSFVALDQISKTVVAWKVVRHSPLEVIPGFLNIIYIRNNGAIFGFFSRSKSPSVSLLLTFASLIALSLVVYYFVKTSYAERVLKVALALILAGAVGNLIDRVLRGYVIDFMDFYFRNWHWPTFNIADSCITIGAFLLLYAFFFQKGKKCSQS